MFILFSVRQKNLKVSNKKNVTRAGRPQSTTTAGRNKQAQTSLPRNTRPRSAKYASRKSGERDKGTENFVNRDDDSKGRKS